MKEKTEKTIKPNAARLLLEIKETCLNRRGKTLGLVKEKMDEAIKSGHMLELGQLLKHADFDERTAEKIRKLNQAECLDFADICNLFGGEIHIKDALEDIKDLPKDVSSLLLLSHVLLPLKIQKGTRLGHYSNPHIGSSVTFLSLSMPDDVENKDGFALAHYGTIVGFISGDLAEKLCLLQARFGEIKEACERVKEIDCNKVRKFVELMDRIRNKK